MSATQFGYFDDWRTAILRCDRCGWTGTFEEGSVQYYRELMDSSCPVCDAWSAPMLAIVSYPTIEECEANREKMSESEKRNLDERKRIIATWESTWLKSEEELPDLAGLSLVFTWDFLVEGSDRFIVIKFGEREIWRELACYEGKIRFKEVVNILKKKYGSRLMDVVPTPESETFLYGDDWGASDFVDSVRASIRGCGHE